MEEDSNLSLFCCPVCKAPLRRESGSLRCQEGHCFDLARKGYVNLLRSNRSAERRHGDSDMMLHARQAFLDGGYYAGLKDLVCTILKEHLGAQARILDVGCGEGYYTAALQQTLVEAGRPAQLAGIDISRDALVLAHRRCPQLELAVASAAALPLQNASQDAVLNIFAPICAGELARVLRPGGLLLLALPLEEHLMGLKKAIYEVPRPNPAPNEQLEGFRLIRREELRSILKLTESEQIKNLFRMTPYFYKTGREDQKKLEQLQELTTELAFCVLLYEKEL